MNSGIFDVNGIEISDGDTVRLTVNILHMDPVVSEQKVCFYRGAYRFKRKSERFQSCIGDIASNCDIEIVSA